MFKNILFKAVALLITLLLYVFVNSQGNRTEVKITVPIEFRNIPSDLVIVEPVDRSVQVVLSGPSYQVATASISGIAFSVRLPEEVGSTYEMNLNRNLINLPNNVELKSITPSTILLKLENEVEKKLSVQIPKLGKVSNNFKLIGLSAEPREVLVKGPSSKVISIKDVKTEAIDLSKLSESGSTRVLLQRPNEYVSLSPLEVKVNFDLASLRGQQTFDNRTVTLMGEFGEEGNYTLSPQVVSIEVSGLKADLKALRPRQIKPFVRIDQSIDGEISIKADIDLPEGFELVKIEPEFIVVTPK